MKILEVKNFTKIYKENDILKIFKKEFWKSKCSVKDLSFYVNKGECLGFLGPNGAGKTTTIKAILNIIKPTFGEIFINGKPHYDSSAKKILAYLPEHPYYYDYLTAYELVEYLASLSGIRGEKLKKNVVESLERVGLGSVMHNKLRSFSKGMVQRVGLASCLASEPELLILDEPMSGLDPLGRKLFRDIFIELKKKSITIFFSSHILADVEMIADRVIIINKGEKIIDDTLENLKFLYEDNVEIIIRKGDYEKIKQEINDLEIIVSGNFTKLIVPNKKKNFLINLLTSNSIEILSLYNQNNNLEDIFSRLIQERSV